MVVFSSLAIGSLVVAAALFAFLNGFHDSANVVATAISSRAMRPSLALMLSALVGFAGPFLAGAAVATTMGREIVAVQAVGAATVLAAFLAAIVWGAFTWLLGIPSSSSHALVGGLVGAAVAGGGFPVVLPSGLLKVILALLLSPLAGLLAGYGLMKGTLWMTRYATPRANLFFCRAQTLTVAALALSHGANDAQKSAGLLTLGLLVSGMLPGFRPSWEVVALCAGAMALGNSIGGWRIIRTVGARFYKIRPLHAFISQLAAGAVILTAALLGGPVSTTHVVNGAIVGVGAAERLSKVRWKVSQQILWAWLLTLPACGLMGGLFSFVIGRMRI